MTAMPNPLPDDRSMSWTLISIVTAVLVVMVEHAARINHKDKLRPSWAIYRAAVLVRWLSEPIGRLFARFSAFLEYLRLDELGHSVYELVVAFVKLVCAPFWVVRGYVFAMRMSDYPWSIACGSLALVFAATVSFQVIFERVPWFRASIESVCVAIGRENPLVVLAFLLLSFSSMVAFIYYMNRTLPVVEKATPAENTIAVPLDTDQVDDEQQDEEKE